MSSGLATPLLNNNTDNQVYLTVRDDEKQAVQPQVTTVNSVAQKTFVQKAKEVCKRVTNGAIGVAFLGAAAYLAVNGSDSYAKGAAGGFALLSGLFIRDAWKGSSNR